MAVPSRQFLSGGIIGIALIATGTLIAQDTDTRGRSDEGPPPFSIMQRGPILAAVDADGDGRISPDELANAPARVRTLDKNGDGTLTREEAGIVFGGRRGRGGDDVPPIPGPTADELLATLLSYDKNGDGRLERAEVPERLQGMFDRSDTNKDGVLDADELRALATAQASSGPGGEDPNRRTGGPGRGPGRSGFGPEDAAFDALDTNHDGVISSDEIRHASTSLKVLDRNNDGWITEDDVRPAPPGDRRG